MKFNIIEKFDVGKLNDKINRFVDKKNYYPYVFLSLSTYNRLLEETEGKYEQISEVTFERAKGAEYKGYKVFVDDTKEFGEVELR